MTSNETQGRTVVGKIISNKMNKTIVVYVERKIRHPKYGKIIKRHAKFHAHDENQLGQPGNIVRIRETKPVSKTKTWELVEVIS